MLQLSTEHKSLFTSVVMIGAFSDQIFREGCIETEAFLDSQNIFIDDKPVLLIIIYYYILLKKVSQNPLLRGFDFRSLQRVRNRCLRVRIVTRYCSIDFGSSCIPQYLLLSFQFSQCVSYTVQRFISLRICYLRDWLIVSSDYWSIGSSETVRFRSPAFGGGFC